ncbi:ABC transporter substrate-binding protein [Bosea sp. (in: a-proteobacteria)]|uniref:ABC transporter substrate-binding protein n=1 Tax=Bosea sp. (in: a-proteobacteria) TaxID=1871050 RepID=UPI0026353B3C|nr:ABC transporter substrate-binding protein [Bosea sp. (in: a-proteobacteria)]MCO5093498.1 ABC transporter substrate-binding protein [Bosea sp. (in: a-proteobacteria)]
MYRRIGAGLLSASLAVISSMGMASAQTLTIGLAAEPTSMDPHFVNLTPNNSLTQHIFPPLMERDAQSRLMPGLATKWEPVDDTTWRITLRQGVTFSNGEAFTARDVIYTICRVPQVPESPSPFTQFTSAITGMKAESDHVLLVSTKEPTPLLPANLSNIGILSASASGGEKQITFNTKGCEGFGKPPVSTAFGNPGFAIGAGPYRLVSFARGETIKLERNPKYWGTAPKWETLVFRPLTNAGARVAALLAGEVDLIENPPTQDLDKINGAGFTISSGLSSRVIFIALDQGPAPTPGIAGDKNPLQDARVREALSIAIDRGAIRDRLMRGQSEPAGQLLPWPLFGAEESRGAVSFNPDRARALLAEAGYPNGFRIVLGGPNDRYVNDGQIIQAVAQMWSRVGVRTEVDAKTFTTFLTDRNAFKYSAYLLGLVVTTGEMSMPLRTLMTTRDASRGLGATNYFRYSNPEVDKTLLTALATVDDARREKLLQKASALAMDDHGIIPLHFELSSWALKPGLKYEPRIDQHTLGFMVTSSN